MAGRKLAGSRPRAQPRPASSRPGMENEDGLPELSRMVMSGSFAEQITLIPKSMSSLILATGRLEDDDRALLVPFIEMMIAGVTQGEVGDSEDIEGDAQTIFSRTVPLENALWLAFDVVRDIRIACAKLRKSFSGEIAMDAGRLAHARFFAEQTRMQAEMCVTLLDEIGGSVAQAQDEPPLPPTRPRMVKRKAI